MAVRKELPTIDVIKYVGEKTVIAKAEIIDNKFGVTLTLTSEVIPFKDNDSLGKKDGKEVLLRASKIFGLYRDEENDNEIFIGIDSALDKFCKAKEIDVEKDLPEKLEIGQILEAFVGLDVVCQKQTDKNFLEII